MFPIFRGINGLKRYSPITPNLAHEFASYIAGESRKRHVRKLATDTYGFPRDILPLQAADIVAYEINKEWQRQADGCMRPKRWPFKQHTKKPFQRRGLL
jgi:hypothetical protein